MERLKLRGSPGKVLRMRRLNLDYTLEGFARYSGVSMTQLHRIERETGLPEEKLRALQARVAAALVELERSAAMSGPVGGEA